MGRPAISLLEPKNLGTPIGDSSHQTYRFTVEQQGKSRVVYYKKISQENHYSALLAKMSVAVSVILRSFEAHDGSEPITAEEVLVYNDQGKLTGTASYAIDDYRSFNFATEGEPVDPTQKASAVPSAETLTSFQVIKTLFKRWFLNDDDSHPHNLGLKGHIDFDMFFFEFTQFMKGDRPFIGNLKRLYNLTVANWISFPKLEQPPYHWPAQDHPGTAQIPLSVVGKLLPKNYLDSAAFAALAGKREVHEQKFEIALAALLMYQPKVLRAELEAHFGNERFDYASLGAELKAKYEKEFPVFCKKETNDRLFIDFMMDLYQQHYDNLYRVVVLFTGCDNNGSNVSLLPTCTELYKKPSYYRKVVDLLKKKNGAAPKDAVKYNEEELEQRYHQVWRDSFAPHLKTLLFQTRELTKRVFDRTKLDTTIEIPAMKATDAADPNLHNILQLFGELLVLNKEQINKAMKVDDNSNLRIAVLSLVDFTTEFQGIVLDYYKVPMEKLAQEANTNFVTKLKKLHASYNVVIRKNLGTNGSDADSFADIAEHIETLGSRIDFVVHLLTNDEQMNKSSGVGAKTIAPATNEELSRQFNSDLFSWINSLSCDEFDTLVRGTIDNEYSTLFSNRKRGPIVKRYLENSKSENNDLRLAYILTATAKPLGELNKLLVVKLARGMLAKRTLSNAAAVFQKPQVDTTLLEIYTKSAVDYAKETYKLITPLPNQPMSLHCDEAIGLVCKEMYARLDKLSEGNFNGIINATNVEYKNKTSYVFFATSDKDMKMYREQYPKEQAKIIALSFAKRDTGSTYNGLLLRNILLKLQNDIRQESTLGEKELKLNSGAELLMRLTVEDCELYLPKMPNHTLEITMKPNNDTKIAVGKVVASRPM